MQNMKLINFSIIDKFIDRVKIADKTNQRSILLDLKEAMLLRETIEQLTLKLLEKNVNNTEKSVTSINADGGKF